jgi:hypothetical protein
VNEVATFRIGGVNDDGLQDAMFLDVLGELIEFGVGELGAWIARVFTQQMDCQQHGTAFASAIRRCRRPELLDIE